MIHNVNDIIYIQGKRFKHFLSSQKRPNFKEVYNIHCAPGILVLICLGLFVERNSIISWNFSIRLPSHSAQPPVVVVVFPNDLNYVTL